MTNLSCRLNIEERLIWIKERVKAAHATGVTIGVSGGKDSSVVLGLVVKALGAENVTAVTMPCGKLNKDVYDAQRICDHLGVKLITIDIKHQYESILEAIEAIEPASEMAKSNIMPRIRMTTLYTIAQTRNQLVVGTDNLSEQIMGYFTKWGDGAYDFNPIADLVVSEVIELGLMLGLPSDLVKKVPSAGLWEGQTDEKEMGVTYKAIEEYIKTGKTDEASMEIIKKTYERTKHKREMPYTFSGLI